MMKPMMMTPSIRNIPPTNEPTWNDVDGDDDGELLGQTGPAPEFIIIIITVVDMTMFMVLSSWHSHRGGSTLG